MTPEPNDQLASQAGAATVLRLNIINRSVAVYNIEVLGEHVYQVGALGAMVHNSYAEFAEQYYNIHNRTMNAIDHTWLRHRFGSYYEDVSRFSSSIATKYQLKGLLTEAIQKGGKTGIVDMGRIIGLSQSGSPTSMLRIFFDSAGKIKTAFPF